MKFIGSVLAGTLGFILVWTHLAFSSQPLSSFNKLQDVIVERKGGDLSIQLKFKNPPAHFQGPKFFKKSVQIDFPSAYVNPSKRFFDTGDDRVRQVYVSQFDPKRLRLRLILAPGASIRKDQTVIEQVGRVLYIRIHSGAKATADIDREVSDPLESLLARASRIQQSKAFQTKTTSGQLSKSVALENQNKVLQSVEIKKPASATTKSEAPVSQLSQVLGRALRDEPAEKVSSSRNLALNTREAGMLDFGSDLSSGDSSLFSASLKMASTLGLVLGLMFVVFHLFKKFGLKNSVFGGDGKPIKVLSTGFLAPRKSIALVEVAGDIIIIGVSNDQISLLGNIQSPERIDQIKNTLNKKHNDSKPFVEPPGSRDQTPVAKDIEGEKPQSKKQGVDVYNKRLIKPGSTNPFGEYVRQFTHASGAEQPTMKDVASRIKKSLEEVPVFK